MNGTILDQEKEAKLKLAKAKLSRFQKKRKVKQKESEQQVNGSTENVDGATENQQTITEHEPDAQSNLIDEAFAIETSNVIPLTFETQSVQQLAFGMDGTENVSANQNTRHEHSPIPTATDQSMSDQHTDTHQLATLSPTLLKENIEIPTSEPPLMARDENASASQTSQSSSWYQQFMGKIAPSLPAGVSSPVMGPVIAMKHTKSQSPARDSLQDPHSFSPSLKEKETFSETNPVQITTPSPTTLLSAMASPPSTATESTTSTEEISRLKLQLNSALSESKNLSSQLLVLKSLNVEQQDRIREYESQVSALTSQLPSLPPVENAHWEQEKVILLQEREMLQNEKIELQRRVEEAQENVRLAGEQTAQMEAWYHEFEGQRVALEEAQRVHYGEVEAFQQKVEEFQLQQQNGVSGIPNGGMVPTTTASADVENDLENIRLQKEYLAHEKEEFEKYKEESLKAVQAKRKSVKEIEDSLAAQKKRLDIDLLEVQKKEDDFAEREKQIVDDKAFVQREKERLESIAQDLETRTTHLSEKETRVSEMTSQYQELLASVHKKEETLAQDYSQLKTRIDTLAQEQQRIDTQQRELHAQKKDIDESESQLKAEKDDLARKREEVDTQKSQLDQQENRQQIKQKYLEERERAISQAEQVRGPSPDPIITSQLQQLEALQTQLEADRDTLTSAQQEFAQYKESVEISFAQREAKLTRLESGTPSGLFFKDEDLLKELNELKEKISVLQREKHSLLEKKGKGRGVDEEEFLRVSHERDQAEQRYGELQSQNAQLLMRIEELELKNQELVQHVFTTGHDVGSLFPTTNTQTVHVATSPIRISTTPTPGTTHGHIMSPTQPHSAPPAPEREDLKDLLIQNMVEIDRLRTYLDPIATALSTAGSDSGHKSAFESDAASVVEYLPHRRVVSAHTKSLNQHEAQTRNSRTHEIVKSLNRNRSISPEKKRPVFETDTESYASSRYGANSFLQHGRRNRGLGGVLESDPEDPDTDASDVSAYYRQQPRHRKSHAALGGHSISRRDDLLPNGNNQYSKLLRHFRSYGDLNSRVWSRPNTHTRGQPSDTSSIGIHTSGTSVVQNPRPVGSSSRLFSTKASGAQNGLTSDYYDSDFTVRGGNVSTGYFTEDDLAGFSSTTRQLLLKGSSTASGPLPLKSSLKSPANMTSPRHSPERSSHRVVINEGTTSSGVTSIIQRSLFTSPKTSNVTPSSDLPGTRDAVRERIRKKLSQRNLVT